MSLDKMLSDLDRHAGLFDLGADLGTELLDAGVDGVKASFAAQQAPDGTPWPELSARYAEVKERYWPGRPILVREGVLVEGLDGERAQSDSSAEYTFGANEQQRAECDWATQGDPLNNRPPRPIVGITEGAAVRSREVLIKHLQDNV